MANPEHFLDDLIERYPDLAPCRADMQSAYSIILEAVQKGRKILLCGNGGSAADASHIAGELLKEFAKRRPLTDEESDLLGDDELATNLQRAIPAISLPDQGSIQSSFSNDVNGTYTFAQLTWALGQEGDILWGISTSGNSTNVIHALKVARARGLKTIGLIGRDGGKMHSQCDASIIAPGANTAQIQERHLPIYHALCMMLEEAIF